MVREPATVRSKPSPWPPPQNPLLTHTTVWQGAAGGMSCFQKNKQTNKKSKKKKTNPTALSVLEISFQPEHAFPSLGET